MSKSPESKESLADVRRRRVASRRDKDVHTAIHHDGSASWTVLRNKHPGKKYIWAYEGSTDTGAEYYASLGYEVERCPKDPAEGPDPGGRRIARPGEPYRSHGHVLMSISAEEWEDIQEYGEDGKTGQTYARILEDKIKKPRFDSPGLLRAAGLREEPDN